MITFFNAQRFLCFFSLFISCYVARGYAQELFSTSISTSCYSERFFWQEAEPIPRLISYVLEDIAGQPILCCCMFYDAQGQVIERTLVGNLSGNCAIPLVIQENGYPEENGIESYNMSDLGFGEGVLGHTEGPLSYFAECTEQAIKGLDLYGFSIGHAWDRLVDSFFTYFRYLQISVHQAKFKFNSELGMPPDIGAKADQIGQWLLGESDYQLMGHCFEETQVDCRGKREVSDKVRVTFINGILTTQRMMLQNLEMISELHGGVNIHYIFRPSEGWTWDILRAMMIKVSFNLGFRSTHAYILAQVWRELIQEMGGVEGAGTIIHYAHSLGGSETDRARDLLSPEEQKMIRVITIGSVTLVRNEGFQSVINYVSKNDGISLLLEPVGYTRNYFDSNTNVCFLRSLENSPYWPGDHLIAGVTYRSLLRQLGEEFLAEFILNPVK